MRASATDLPVTIDMPGFESRQTVWSDLNVAREKLAPADYTELFSKLPGGHCSCPHWGYVVSGKVRVKYADHDEVLAAGEYQKTMAALEQNVLWQPENSDLSEDCSCQVPATMSRNRSVLRPRANPASRAGVTQGEHHGQVPVAQALPRRAGACERCPDGPVDA